MPPIRYGKFNWDMFWGIVMTLAGAAAVVFILYEII